MAVLLLELASAAVKILTVVLAPILLLYVAVAWNGPDARRSREAKSELWMLLLVAAGLGLSQLFSFYGDYAGDDVFAFASSLLILAVLLSLFLTVRVKVGAASQEHTTRRLAVARKTRAVKRSKK